MDEYPIDLKQLFFTKSVVEAVPNYIADPAKDTIEHAPENSLEVTRVDEENNQYLVGMKTIFNPDKDNKSPYMAEMQCVALFTANAKSSEEEIQKALRIVGHNVVYGAIRESILWITSRHVNGPLTLGLSILRPKLISDEDLKKPQNVV